MDSARTTLTQAGQQKPVPRSPAAALERSATWKERAEEWVWIEPGRFLMGSPESEPGRDADEGPQHEVAIGRGFYLGKYPITQGQWREVMGTTPWLGRGRVRSSPTHPAVFVSWNDLQEFAARLNEASGEALYRLPSEAEWEHACRAGTVTVWSFGEDRHKLAEHAWYIDSDEDADEQSAHDVGTKLPNPWGLHDMHGNVWEWCQDVYSDGNVSASPTAEPPGPDSARVVRGGYFRYFPRHSRSAARNARWPYDRQRALGGRLVKIAQ
jgi:formylglycine-generating enzyme required for sulfatase activity